MQINWTNPTPMLPLLAELSEIKRDWRHLVKPENFFVAQSPEGIVLYGYMQGDETLLCCFNLSADAFCQVDLKVAVPGRCPMTVTLDSSLTGSSVGQAFECLLLAPNQALVLVNNHRQFR